MDRFEIDQDLRMLLGALEAVLGVDFDEDEIDRLYREAAMGRAPAKRYAMSETVALVVEDNEPEHALIEADAPPHRQAIVEHIIRAYHFAREVGGSSLTAKEPFPVAFMRTTERFIDWSGEAPAARDADDAEAQDGAPIGPGSEEAICPHCMTGNHPLDDFCSGCGRPMTSLATMDPFKKIFAEGYVYRSVVSTGRPRWWLVVAMWALLAPSIALVCWMNFCTHGPSYFDGSGLIERFLNRLLASLPLLIAGGIYCLLLYRVTWNYLDGGPADAEAHDNTNAPAPPPDND